MDGTVLQRVRRLVGAVGRVTRHPARARSAPEASREGRTSSSFTATSRLAKAVTSHRIPQRASSLWSAPAERSDDGALAFEQPYAAQAKAVSRRCACHRSP